MSAVARYGKWRIKPSGQLPIFLRYMINSSFNEESARKAKIRTVLKNRTYLNHMMYWKAVEYDEFENEIIGHLKKKDKWFEDYYHRELKQAENLYKVGQKLERIDWKAKSRQEISRILRDLLIDYRDISCPWYAQYPLDQYFEDVIEKNLTRCLPQGSSEIRRNLLIFTDPMVATEVSLERLNLIKLAKKFKIDKENPRRLSARAKKAIYAHLERYAYINRGLATSKPYTFEDIVKRLIELYKMINDGQTLAEMIYSASEKKIRDDYRHALEIVRPDREFKKIIEMARKHSYLRNRRVEAFFKADYGASFMYAEIARRNGFNPDYVMELTTDEMFACLEGKKLPAQAEIKRRLKNYAMIVRNTRTTLISDPAVIQKMEKTYYVKAISTQEISGKVACLGGVVKGKAKICLDKKNISKVKKGDILVAQFTTPDFVPAMEKAAAIIADQGGVSSHAAIVSRELGVPCIIDAKNATRIIRDNDLIEVNSRTGVIKILKRYGR